MSKHPQGYCPVFGNYPKEYNRKVHGPYYPWVNYGPKDTPLSEVKLGEFKNWFSRQPKTPAAAIAYCARTSSNYQRKWLQTRYGSPSKGLLQVVTMTCFISWILNWNVWQMERGHKYHW